MAESNKLDAEAPQLCGLEEDAISSPPHLSSPYLLNPESNNENIDQSQSCDDHAQKFTVVRDHRGEEVYFDENGDEIRLLEPDNGLIEFNHIDNNHVQCSMCGEIVPFDRLIDDHLPQKHPEVLNGATNFEEVSFNGFMTIKEEPEYVEDPNGYTCMPLRPLRKMSKYRAYPHEMDFRSLEMTLQRKVWEKLERRVPVSLVDKLHAKCGICNTIISINKKFETSHVARHFDAWHHKSAQNVLNSKVQLGRTKKIKRNFVKPSFRQTAPRNSEFIEEVSASHWMCKLCRADIYGAVISASAINHYKNEHSAQLESMQYQVCKARLEKVSSGIMAFVHPQLVECLRCPLMVPLHKPYNVSRAIRHLKNVHPYVMPEYSAMTEDVAIDAVHLGEVIEDPELLQRFRQQYDVAFDKVQVVYNGSKDPVYVLLDKEDRVDFITAAEMMESLGETQNYRSKASMKPVLPTASKSVWDVTDPLGKLTEDLEINDMESGMPENETKFDNNRDAVVPEVMEQ